ncbi:hypothetical protein M422DRAFT_247307 [Sphaerobolus stellatus SS14]|nr:hypothetical protein M422DRAFT_247307 [Sphaerobolus stellatus SS14]
MTLQYPFVIFLETILEDKEDVIRPRKIAYLGLSTTIALPALPPTLAFSPVLVSATAALVATGASSHNPFTASPGNTFHRAIHCVCVVGEAGFECGGRRFKGEVGAGMSIEGWGDIETPGED